MVRDSRGGYARWRDWPIVLLMVFTASVAADTIIVDNLDPEFAILSGSGWITYSAPGQWSWNYLYYNTSDPISEVEWRPMIPLTGDYEVAVWYRAVPLRPRDAHYTVHYNGGTADQYVDQTQNGEQWVTLGTYDFAAGSTGRVTLVTDAEPETNIVADAVRFRSTRVGLTMAVSPPGAGWTVPAEGGPYVQDVDDVVAIEASPIGEYEFYRWDVSGGSPPADPSSPTTTVVVDQTKTVTAVFSDGREFRGFWADAFHSGFKSTSEIDAMVAHAVAGNYNAVIPEVLAYQDDVGGGHGAYWDSDIVPEASDIVGSFDPLSYLVEQAHANNIEVHCWLVAYRVCTAWPPSGNSVVQPEWIMVPQGDMGNGPATVDGKYTLDPGSPDVQEYLVGIVRELVSNYAIDGIHWDYVRYTNKNAGYPSDTSYAQSGLARFQEITGYAGTPPYTGNSQWDDFRRREVTELVRRMRVEVAAIESNPRQPLRHSAALITWGNAPSSFTSSSAYGIFQNWREWMELGYLDAGIPMAYYRETQYPTWYRNWVNAAIGWRYDRHMCIGPGIYLNSFSESITQMEYARDAGADGSSTYSYRSTNDTGQTWSDWYPYAASNVFAQPSAMPPMPWRDPATATEGTLYGRIVEAGTGEAIDDAIVTVSGMSSVQTDGNGFYVKTMVPATGPGTSCQVMASKPGDYLARVRLATVVAGNVAELNIPLGALCFGDYDGDGDVDLDDHAAFLTCLTGPDASGLPVGCDVFDSDTDDDVDEGDFSAFQVAFTGE